MKIQVQNYTFDKTAKTVKFTDYASIRLDSVLLITNVTSNIIIYNFADPTKGGTVLTNVLTLDYNTSAMNNIDSLQIFYEDGLYPASQTLQTTLNTLMNNDNTTNRQLLQLLKPLGIVSSASGRIYFDVNVLAGTLPGVTTVNTVSSVTNQVNMGGLNALDLQFNMAHAAFALGLRSNITF